MKIAPTRRGLLGLFAASAVVPAAIAAPAVAQPMDPVSEAREAIAGLKSKLAERAAEPEGELRSASVGALTGALKWWYSELALLEGRA